MIKHFALATSVLAICASGAFAQNTKAKLTDPVEILKRADAASKAVTVAQYEAESFAFDAEGKTTPIGHGKAAIMGFAGRGPEKFNISGKFKRRGSEEEQHLTIGTDSEDYYLIDWATKKAYVDIDPAVTGRRGGLVGSIMMAEYVHATPFTDELNGTAQKLIGMTKVADEDCYEILVTYADGALQAKWFFSAKDYLPRRVDRLRKIDGKPVGGTRTVVTKFKAEPKDAEKLFKFKLPDGFEQVDDFAP